MRKLLILWDPENPIVPAAPLVQALSGKAELQVAVLTFNEIGHRTLPNRAFKLRPALGGMEPDGILWIEGGPLPEDLEHFSCPRACWVVNTHLEPSLLEDVGSMFDCIFSASLEDTAQEKARWLPIGASMGSRVLCPSGVSLLMDDPKSPRHSEIEQILIAAAEDLGRSPTPIVICLGNAGRAHPMLYEALRSGAAVVVDPECDLRGLAHSGDHLERYPSKEELGRFIGALEKEPDRLSKLAARGPAIVDHLHSPELLATQVCQGIWPVARVLSGGGHGSRVSILVTCYRYLRRFRVCLEGLARQHLPAGTLEIVVADPQSPDGLAGYLENVAAQHPDLRIVHVPLDARYHRNRGVGINRAFDASQGQVVIGIDGDVVFPPHLIKSLEERVLASPERVFGVRRSFIAKRETEKILEGTLDPFSSFEDLSRSGGDGEEKGFVGVLGYCQAVHRKAFAQARYPEEFDMVNQSDIMFVERLGKQARVSPMYLESETVLHLWHPRNWSGTSEFL